VARQGKAAANYAEKGRDVLLDVDYEGTSSHEEGRYRCLQP